MKMNFCNGYNHARITLSTNNTSGFLCSDEVILFIYYLFKLIIHVMRFEQFFIGPD